MAFNDVFMSEKKGQKLPKMYIYVFQLFIKF